MKESSTSTGIRPLQPGESRVITPDIVQKVTQDGMTYLDLTPEAALEAARIGIVGYESWRLRRKFRLF